MFQYQIVRVIIVNVRDRQTDINIEGETERATEADSYMERDSDSKRCQNSIRHTDIQIDGQLDQHICYKRQIFQPTLYNLPSDIQTNRQTDRRTVRPTTHML